MSDKDTSEAKCKTIRRYIGVRRWGEGTRGRIAGEIGTNLGGERSVSSEKM